MQRSSSSTRETMFELLDVARAMRTFIDQRAREHAMTRAQWGVLVRLERQEGMTQAEMAKLLEKTKQAALTGKYEPFKTTSQFDGTAHHPEWMG